MAAPDRHSFLHRLLLLLFLSCGSSCPSSPFSCGNFTADIKPPFATSTSKPVCGGLHQIKCHATTPIIQFRGQGPWYPLRNISYSENSLIVQDQQVGDPSWGSGCNFLYDAVSPVPLRNNISHLAQMLITEEFFFNCTMVEHDFSHEFLLQFRRSYPCRDYNFYYTSKLDDQTLRVLPTSCLARVPPLFEWKLSFREEDGGLRLLSAGFSHQLELRHDCFNCQAIGATCSINGAQSGAVCGPGTKGVRNIIIGVATGGAGFLGLCCCLFLFLYRRRKRQQQSSSSLLLRSPSFGKSPNKDPELGSTIYQIQNFTYKELQEATDGFDESKELGDGGFGTVYKGKLRDGRTVAVKRLYENNYRRVEQFMNEIVILSRLRHQNLVTLYGCSSRHSRELVLVYEFVPNGTVADHLHGSRADEGALTWPIRMNIAIETADALAYLHAIEPQIIHRDVKTNNILLDNGFHVKVADFGLSRLFPLDATHVSTAPQGTPGYVDPEYHQCYQLTDKSDVYSFGVVLIELISSMPAVDISRHRHEINLASMAVHKIQNRELDQLVDPGLGYESDCEVKSMITQVAELAFRCLQADGDMRPPIKEALEVLQGIQSGWKKAEKATDSDANIRNSTPLLKTAVPYSPDSVTDQWASRSTTSNASN